jgi:uncharacterized membrane protein
MSNRTTVTCELCGKSIPAADGVPATAIPDGIAGLILKDYPGWKREGYVSRAILSRYQAAFIASILEAERGELSALEHEVIDSIAQQEILAEDVNADFEKGLTPGQRVADAVAAFGGSWRFIIIFAAVIVLWIGLNAAVLLFKPFDPYPFILLNLVLSCLAAIQAPVIMMSQNRQEAKDRLRAEHDYKVNLKAELEIRKLHDKLDYLLNQQWERLLEIQQLQIEMLNDVVATQAKAPPKPAPRKRIK